MVGGAPVQGRRGAALSPGPPPAPAWGAPRSLGARGRPPGAEGAAPAPPEMEAPSPEASLWPAVAAIQAVDQTVDGHGVRLLRLEGRVASAEQQLAGCRRAAAEAEGRWAALGALLQQVGALQRRLESVENLLKNRNFWILRFPPGCSGEAAQVPVTFDDLSVYFNEHEWGDLDELQKDLYKMVMRSNYEMLVSMDYAIAKPEILTRIERGDSLYDADVGTLPGSSMPGPLGADSPVAPVDVSLWLKEEIEEPQDGNARPPGEINAGLHEGSSMELMDVSSGIKEEVEEVCLDPGESPKEEMPRDASQEYQAVTVSEGHLSGSQEGQCVQDPLFFGEGPSSGVRNFFLRTLERERSLLLPGKHFAKGQAGQEEDEVLHNSLLFSLAMSSKGKRRRPSSAEARSKKQRKAISLDLKMKIIKAYDAGKKVNIIAQEEGLAHSTISTILKNKEKIREAMKGSPGTTAVITRQRKGLIHETEKLLMLWIEDQIQKKRPVGLLLIQAKACSIFKTLKERAGEECTETFTASRGWFMRFQRRFNYHSPHTSGEARGLDREAAKRFLEELDGIVAGGSYLPDQIFNVDETGLFWKKMPERTYIHKEAQAVPGYKAFKDRVTLLLGGSASGFKLKPFLIYKSEHPSAFKNVSEHALPVYYRSSWKTWMTRVLFEDWFMNCFIPQVKEYCLQSRIPFKILLLLDNTPGHPPHLDGLHPDVKVVYLPQNTAPLLQPMDQGAFAAFKAYYLHAMFAKAVAAMADRRVTLRDFWKGYNIQHCIKNIAAAWQEVSMKCMQGIWKKCLKRLALLVNNFEVFDHNNHLDEINKNILTLAKSLDLEVDAEDVRKWIAYSEGELSNEDLIELKEELEARRVLEEEL